MIDNLSQTATDLNTVARFLAAPDVLELTPSALNERVGGETVDLVILLGNAVLQTMDAVAEAVRSGGTDELLIIGGKGHSTPHLRAAVRSDPRYEGHQIEGTAEAVILQDLLCRWHGLDDAKISTGTQSSNCGENAEEAYEHLSSRETFPSEVILVQDPTLQLRTWASFRRVWGEGPGPHFYNCPTFVPAVEVEEEDLVFEGPQRAGLWPMDRFLSLVMGEVPRLRNDEHGYGPNGQDFIVAVDIPPAVSAAYERLLEPFGDLVRPPQ